MADVTTLNRIFKIGSTRIVESDTMRGLSNEQVRGILKATYPEIANSTISERSDGEHRMVEFLPVAGRKG